MDCAIGTTPSMLMSKTELMFAPEFGSGAGLARSLKMLSGVYDNCTSRSVLQLRFLHLVVEKSET